MPDTLSAMREFRFLDDKRNGGGLSQLEEGRWQELAQQLQQTPAVPSVDPVVYAQELIAQGYDPVQAFVHVGFSLEQIAASGYDVSAYQQPQTDPQAYAAALIAQGYDEATAYAAAGLPVPTASAEAPQPAIESASKPAANNHAELDFADAELVEEVPHPSIPDDGTGGWTAESRGLEPTPTPMTRPELEMWRTPSKAPVSLPEPGPVPHIDTHLPVEVAPAWESGGPAADSGSLAAEMAATAVIAEAVSSPFEPTLPEPLPPGVHDHVPPSRELVAAESAPASEPSADGMAAIAGLEAMREVELEAESASLELGASEDQPQAAMSALDAREIDLSAGSEEPLPELDMERAESPVAPPEAMAALSQELDLPAPERHESEWDMDADAAAATAEAAEVAPALSLDLPPAEVRAPAEEQQPTDAGSLPVLDAAALEAEVIPEGIPTRMMPALAVERLVSRTAPSEEWSTDTTSEEQPAPEASLSLSIPDVSADVGPAEPVAAPSAEWAVPEARVPEVPLAAEPVAEAVGPGAEPAALEAIEAPVAPAEAAGVGPAWPTVAELSDWSSPDKGEYAAWAASSGGVQPYPDFAEADLAAQLGAVGSGSVPVASGPAAVGSALFESSEPLPESSPVLESGSNEWGAPALPEALPSLDIPGAQVQGSPAEWADSPSAESDVVLDPADVVEEAPVSPDLAVPAPSIRGGQVRPPSDPLPPPQAIAAPPVQVVIPPATTRKPSVVVDPSALAAPPPPPPPPSKPPLDIMPARVAQQPRAPSIVIDHAQLSEEAAMAVDDSAFTPAAGSPVRSPAPSLHLPGERRVIVHMMDGSVRRGSFHDLDLNAAQLTLASQTGIIESIPRDRIKAIFFMLAPGASAPAIEGSKLRVTFTDGRNIVGFSGGYDPNAVGFFIIPADARTNTERVFVLKAAIRSVANG